MSVECTQGCGRQTNSPSGVCAICQLFPEENGGESMREKKEQTRSSHRKCSFEGCDKWQVKNRMCVRHYRASLGQRQAEAKPEAKPPAVELADPDESLHEAIMHYSRRRIAQEILPVIGHLEQALASSGRG